jgi:hypothetical protein
MVRVEAVVEGSGSTVGGMGCNLVGHEDNVKTLGSAGTCGYFVVKAKLSCMDVNEAEAGSKLSHCFCGTAKFFVEIPTEYNFMMIVDFGFEE